MPTRATLPQAPRIPQVPSAEPTADGPLRLLLRLLLLVALLYGFLVAIETMSKAIKALSESGWLGQGGAEGELFRGVSNPFAGLAIGVLFTVMVQSSSTTTSTIVAVVGSGALSVEHALPMIMGANIGTTITNTLVSIGHVRRSAEFRRAFSAATVHDFFNLICVAVFLPLELTTRVISRTASALASRLDFGGSDYQSPIKAWIKSGHKGIGGLLDGLGLEGNGLQIALLLAGIGLTFLCLFQITKNMRVLLAGPIERAMNKVLESSAVFGIAIGTVLTMAVQSSSITTSLLVPMCAAGVLTLAGAFPIMLGANIGTTITAMLASLAQDSSAALTIALVHVLFNLGGVCVLYPIPPLRRLPLRAAESLAAVAAVNRLWVLVYVVGVFVVLPLCGWLLWGGTSG